MEARAAAQREPRTVLSRLRSRSRSEVPAAAGHRNGRQPTTSPARIRRYHSHTPGILYIGFTLLLAIGAINSQNNLLFLALGLAIGGLLISGILSGTSLMGLRLERHVPGRAVVGAPLRIRYRVINANRFFSAFGLHVVENAARRRFLWNRSDIELPWPRFFEQPRSFVMHVPPANHIESEIRVVPRARGAIALEGVQIWSTFPFGLTRKSVNFALERTILVLPAELTLRTGVLRRLTTRSHSGAGAENLPGHGEDFFGLRDYQAGDSLRQIAWKRTARTGQLVVRQNAAPSPPRLLVVLDFHTAPPPAPRQHGLDERAIALVATLIRMAAKDGMAVGLSILGGRVHHPPREGRAHVERLLTELALLEPAAIPAGGTTRGVVSRGSACVVVHAGDIDKASGPPGAHHLSAARLEDLLVGDDPSTAAVLEVLDGADAISRPQQSPALRWYQSAKRMLGLSVEAPGDSMPANPHRQRAGRGQHGGQP